MDSPLTMIDRLTANKTGPRISPSEHLVWLEIVRRVAKTGSTEIRFHGQDLADGAGVHRRRVSAALPALVARGLIDYTPLHGKSAVQTLRVTTAEAAAA